MYEWVTNINLNEIIRSRLVNDIQRTAGSNDPGYDHVSDILAYIFEESDKFSLDLLRTSDGQFYKNIIKTRENPSDGFDPIVICGTDFDGTIRHQKSPATVGELCNIVSMSRIAPTKGLAVLASVRDDGPYLIEWIAHHRALGVDKFFIYSNDNSDSSDMLLRELAERGIITYIKNEIGPTTHPSLKSYTHALHFLPELRQYRWLFVLDSDEFVWVNEPISSLIELLERRTEHTAVCLLLNWQWFGSHVFRFEDRPLSARFLHWRPDRHVKSLFRPRDAVRIFSHHPILKAPYILLDSRFVEKHFEDINNFTEYGVGAIRHYWQKSFEEYSLKVARGKGRAGYERGFEEFFSWNIMHSTASVIAHDEVFDRKVADEIDILLSISDIGVARKNSVIAASEMIQKNVLEFDLTNAFKVGMEKYSWIKK